MENQEIINKLELYKYVINFIDRAIDYNFYVHQNIGQIYDMKYLVISNPEKEEMDFKNQFCKLFFKIMKDLGYNEYKEVNNGTELEFFIKRCKR